MSKFTNKEKKEMAAVSTASLPDIVFMLLFFFMVVTVMKDKDPLVKVDLPTATEIQKIEDKEKAAFLSVGPPVDAKRGTDPVLQLNDDYAEISDIPEWVGLTKESKPEDIRGKLVWVLNVDKETKWVKFLL